MILFRTVANDMKIFMFVMFRESDFLFTCLSVEHYGYITKCFMCIVYCMMLARVVDIL